MLNLSCFNCIEIILTVANPAILIKGDNPKGDDKLFGGKTFTKNCMKTKEIGRRTYSYPLLIDFIHRNFYRIKIKCIKLDYF